MTLLGVVIVCIIDAKIHEDYLEYHVHGLFDIVEDLVLVPPL